MKIVVDELMAKVSPSLKTWIRKRGPVRTWEATAGPPEWAAHIKKLQIPNVRGPNLLLHGIGNQSWLDHDPSINQRVQEIFKEGFHTLR